jgi:hypothetical protein
MDSHRHDKYLLASFFFPAYATLAGKFIRHLGRADEVISGNVRLLPLADIPLAPTSL